MDGQDGMFFYAFAAVMLMSVIVGMINGFCTVKIGLPALIVTLAISNIITRLQYVFTQGSPTGFAGPAFVSSVISRIFGHIPSLALYAIIIFPLVFFILNRSRFGRQLYLVGNNATAAGLTGINVNRVKIFSYIISAMFAGFTGMLAAGFMQRAQCQMFDDYAYNSLIAVIVGGTAFSGGVGSYSGTIAGALLMVVLTNMLTALFLPQPIRNIIMGMILVLLLLFYNRKKAVRQ
jgi:ribose transport system permease protein